MSRINVKAVLEESKQVLRECFKQYKLDEVFLSFNGGKDCTVLLHITIDVLKEIYKRQDIATELKVVYIRTKEPFKEIEEFVQQIKKTYGVNLVIMEGDMKESLQKLLEEDKNLKACLLGSRKTDPFCENMTFMQATDPNWPQIMRVCPLLNWNYYEVWSYIHDRQMAYCSLYDKGYTSIGSVEDTRPNPTLIFIDNHNHCHCWPAWRLEDPKLERAGRGKAEAKPTVNLHSQLYSKMGKRNSHSNIH